MLEFFLGIIALYCVGRAVFWYIDTADKVNKEWDRTH